MLPAAVVVLLFVLENPRRVCGPHSCVANLPPGCAGFPMRGRRVGMAAEALTVPLGVLNLTVTLRRQREPADRRAIPNMLFTSSIVLARWIVRHAELFQHKRVLELGAGLGLAGACVRERRRSSNEIIPHLARASTRSPTHAPVQSSCHRASGSALRRV